MSSIQEVTGMGGCARVCMPHDAGNHILEVDYVYEAGSFRLFCVSDGVPDIFTVRFTAPADFAAGNTFTVKGEQLSVVHPTMKAAAAGVFKSGAVVLCDIDQKRKLVFVGTGAAALPGTATESYVDAAVAGKADRHEGFLDCDAIYAGGVHTLTPRKTPPSPLPDFFSVRFIATAAVSDGDAVSIGGVVNPLLDYEKKPLAANAFAADTVVELHVKENAVFF